MDKERIIIEISDILKSSRKSMLSTLGFSMPKEKAEFLITLNFDKDIIFDDANSNKKIYYDKLDNKIHVSPNVKNLDDLKTDLVQTLMMEIIDLREKDKVINDSDEIRKYTPGEFLSRGLVELYSQRIKYDINYDVQTKKEYMGALEFAQRLESTITRAQLPYFIFKMSAEELLNYASDDFLLEEYKKKEQEYIDALDGILEPDKDMTLESIIEETENKMESDSVINIIYHVNKEGDPQAYIKFKMHENEEFRVIKINNSSEAIKTYTKLLTERDNSKPLTAEELISVFMGEEIILHDEKIFAISDLPNLSNQDFINHMQVIDYANSIYHNKTTDIQSNAEEGIYLTEEEDTIIAEDKPDGTLDFTTYQDADTQQISISKDDLATKATIISYERYKELIYKDDRTPEEDNLIFAYEVANGTKEIREYTPSEQQVLEDDLAAQMDPNFKREKPITRRLLTNKYRDYSNAAFVSPLMAALIVAMTIVVGIATALVLYSTLG